MPGIAAPRGTRDLLPAAAPAWEWLHRTHAEVAALFGYRLVDTPVFEHTELFERGVGTGTDVVDKEMYTFTDRGGRSLTLRPEGTAGVVRAVMQAGALEELRPLRVHYAQAMFRYDRPQAGRYRQFAQVGVECIGERSPMLDAEVIELGWRFLAALGLHGVSLQVNSIGDRDDRLRYRERLIAYYEPHEQQLCEDCRRRLRVNPLRLLDCKRDAGLVAGAPRITDQLSPASMAYYETVLAALDSAGVAAEPNARLVRGLDYYAHTAFEFWHRSLQGAQNALGGGGRYDGLAEELGYGATPGVGYAMGVERILIVAGESGVIPAGVRPVDVAVCSVGEEQALAAAEVARRLRAAGVRTVLDGGTRRLDRKLRGADRQGARLCVILGEDEVRDGTVVLRDLIARTQGTVPLAAAVDAVRRALPTEE